MNKKLIGNETVYTKIKKNNYVKVDPSGINRAFLFGDGIFETLVYQKGKIRFAQAHEERARTGMAALKLDSYRASNLNEITDFIRETFGLDRSLRIRWNIFRGGLGKYTPASKSISENLIIQPFVAAKKVKETAYLCTDIHLSASPWSHCKTLNSLPYVMANLERKEKGMDEVILTDDKCYISEAGSSNLFWIKKGVYYTPSLYHHCIAGIGRRHIIKTLMSSGLPLQEGSYTCNDLLEADQVFTSNVTGIAYIKNFLGKTFSVNPVSVIENIFRK